ncbi:hypothetical protein V5740_02535 [Croceibacterium sp. TMG7-5b_MA50]|uniref:hypothetical protein n=1 Tax=Croceibacterium sp. TMG7-5b_MA50 TaxID=3121290 RepID=UPI00322147DD
MRRAIGGRVDALAFGDASCSIGGVTTGAPPSTQLTGRRILPALWGWAILLVVLLSATPSGAQTSPRIVGSAFDPATLSVTIRPQERDEIVRAEAVRRDDALADLPGAVPAPTWHGVARTHDDRGSPQRVTARGPPDHPLLAFRHAGPARAPPTI